MPTFAQIFMLEMNTRKTRTGGNDSKKKPLKGKMNRTNKGAKAERNSKENPKSATSSKDDKDRKLSAKEAKGKGRYQDFKERVKKGDPLPTFSDTIRLNKYLSNAGICSRRDADVLIKTGVVTVNGVPVLEMGFKVGPNDVVKYDGGAIKSQKKQYVLLNKPKGFITTMDDPLNRKTVMSLVRKACKERVYPVGRLDKETTGLMLFTNDGDMAKKLTHPLQKASKIYQVELNKKVTSIDLKKLVDGIKLEDGTAKFDKAEFVKVEDARIVGIELHSGKNRIVRRVFESLGYVVAKLDRVTFAGLNKKDLPRGMFRHLTEKEIAFLKMVRQPNEKENSPKKGAFQKKEKVAGEVKADTKLKVVKKPKVEAKAETKLTVVKKTKVEKVVTVEAEPKLKVVKAKAEPKAKVAKATKAEPKAKAATKVKAEPKAKVAKATKAVVKVKVEKKPKAEPKVKAVAKAKAEPKAKVAKVTKTVAKVKAEPKAKVAKATKTVAKVKAEPKAKVAKATKAAVKVKAEPKAKVAKAKAEPKAKKAVAKVKVEKKPKAESKAKVEKKPTKK